jgi:hypothetical protein
MKMKQSVITSFAILSGTLLAMLACSESAIAQDPVNLFRGVLSENGENLAEMEDQPELETDRDSFTPATSTVAMSRFMVESAWSFVDNRDVAETHSLPEFLLRYGATDWFELRLGANYEVGGESSGISSGSSGDGEFEELGDSGVESESTISYGAKVFLTEQDAWLPASAVIVQGATPTSGAETATSLTTTYVAGWMFANDWQWDSSIRYGTASAEGDHFNLWAPSTVIKAPRATGSRFTPSTLVSFPRDAKWRPTNTT